jgi:chaperonin cofactor prefoldin
MRRVHEAERMITTLENQIEKLQTELEKVNSVID